ncbi:hypothetical protein HZB08_01225 [Candidatus Saganbacteria bacterium]|uniref:Uncharacterized protein n=1 Tax=Candidatus Saganbacteria bacterium TaxID=2575572 RepID=A0A9D6YVR6_UNCSA|nr:hypothetical protein [Candidatus Saganbacteria bacterium]
MKGVAEVSVCPRIWKVYNQIALAREPVIDFPKPEGLAGEIKQEDLEKKGISIGTGEGEGEEEQNEEAN